MFRQRVGLFVVRELLTVFAVDQVGVRGRRFFTSDGFEETFPMVSRVARSIVKVSSVLVGEGVLNIPSAVSEILPAGVTRGDLVPFVKASFFLYISYSLRV